MRRSHHVYPLVLLALIVAAGPAAAQTTTAILKGRLVDSSGTGLPSVTVQVKSKTQPSGNKTIVTDIEGNYRIPLLPPASDYFIKVDYPGFAPIEVGPIDLDAGKTFVQDVTIRTSEELVT